MIMDSPQDLPVAEHAPTSCTFEQVNSLLEQFISDFHLPLYRKMEFYDNAGCLHVKDPTLSSQPKVPGIYNPLLSNTLVVSWVSYYELEALYNACPELLIQTEARQKLKPNRTPHPFDGFIHYVEIWFSQNEEPLIRVCYTSAVPRNKQERQALKEEGDEVHLEFKNLWSFLTLTPSDVGMSGDYPWPNSL